MLETLNGRRYMSSSQVSLPSSEKKRDLPSAKGGILEKAEMTMTTYPDLQPFIEMMIVLFEGVYEHAHEVGMAATVRQTHTQ